MSPLPALALALAALATDADDPDAYRAEVENWRQDRLRRLTADDGWLTLAGLHWLRPGATTLGSGPDSDVVLPAGSPEELGTLTLEGDSASLELAPGVEARLGREPFKGGAVPVNGAAVAVGDLRLLVIQRGDRYALRVKDNRSPARAAFAGLAYFPVDPKWRVEARFTPRTSPTRLVFDTIVGTQDVLESAGVVEFEVDGRACTLEAAREGDHLWFVFRDGTSGKTTHPNARQLQADAPDARGVVVLDFNKAINLPCAFTPYATCPLAPKQNRLAVPIEAGEKAYAPATGLGRGRRAANPG